MAKATILDRLAGAMKTLGKREGKALTPRQRVAAAQRFNNLADIYAKELGRIESKDHKEFLRTLRDNEQLGLVSEPWLRNIDIDAIPDAELAAGADVDINDNPFLSDNIGKYLEQDEFLNWCRHNKVEPSGRNLKQFRWETYKTLPYRQRQWIANKDDIRQALRDEGFVSPYADDLRTLQDVDDATLDYAGSKYDFMRLPVYESPDEFPDDFDYMWRY